MTSFAGRIANLLPGPVTRWLRYASLRRGRRTWSQEGEDGILARIFEGQRQGFYVDVGAHHPFRFSNTYFFYRQGWRGLNIDAAPGSMRPFRSHRPRDINVECGIGLTAGRQDFFVFNDPALSTFDPVQAKLRNVPPWRVLETIAVPVRPLREVPERRQMSSESQARQLQARVRESRSSPPPEACGSGSLQGTSARMPERRRQRRFRSFS